jgi:DNA-binding transcriptional MerR regulator
MTATSSTGSLARATGLSQRAVRWYADSGLLRAERDPATGARVFDADQVTRARRIALLRGLGVPLPDVARVLDADDPVRTFDAWWSDRRRAGERAAAAGEHVRAVLADASGAPDGVRVTYRDVPERLLLSLPATASLPDMGAVLRASTSALLSAMTSLHASPAGPLHVEIRSRATETAPADLRVCVPVHEPVRPLAGTALTLDPAHREAVVALTQHQADDQRLVVAVHDHLSTGAFARGARPDAGDPCGHNREVYLPQFGTGAAGTVMEVVVPVDARPAG